MDRKKLDELESHLYKAKSKEEWSKMYNKYVEATEKSRSKEKSYNAEPIQNYISYPSIHSTNINSCGFGNLH